MLITVSGIAWRLTSQDAPSCRAMLGLGPLLSATPISDQSGECGGTGVGTEPSRRFLTRIPPTYGRPHHPYAAMMYPEFQYRPPPPSYQASMQEYRLRLLLLDRDRHNQQQQQPQQSQSAAPSRPSCTVAPLQPPPPVSPPPTYRSQASTLRYQPHLGHLSALCVGGPAAVDSKWPTWQLLPADCTPNLSPHFCLFTALAAFGTHR